MKQGSGRPIRKFWGALGVGAAVVGARFLGLDAAAVGMTDGALSPAVEQAIVNIGQLAAILAALYKTRPGASDGDVTTD